MLHDLARTSARRTPDALAVCAPDGTLTYAELDMLADRIALGLKGLGVRPGDRVAIWLEKSATAVATMQAALRIGAVYVPLFELLPLQRAVSLLLDCAPTVVVTSAAHAKDLEESGIRAALLTTDAGYVWENMLTLPPRRLAGGSRNPNDPAYILYTSGSTGDPKGVCLSHRNALAFVDWAGEEIQARRGDHFANHAPLNFDLSVFDLYVAFGAGACVHLIPHHMAYSPQRLVEFIDHHKITVWYSVPAALILMMRHSDLLAHGPETLRAVLFAGEEFPLVPLRRLTESLVGVRFLNLYGPTETNVCTFHPVEEISADRMLPVPIGTACSGASVTAVDHNGRIAGPGEIGELIVEGPTVMLGYWGRPPQGDRPYATGDLVRVLDGGGFQFIGRQDSMAKVRGHRVELGEVEAVLADHPGIEDVAVIVVGRSIDARIVAFVVPTGSGVPTLLDCKRHCSQRLPRYAVVDAVHPIPAIPRTRNGKVDREGLRALVD